MQTDSSFDPAAAEARAEHQEELLQRSRQGDPDAFGELALSHRGVALRVAAASSRSVDPEDVVAEALVRIWAALRAGGGPEHAFGPYLRATVRNVALTMATRQREQPTACDQLESALQRSARAGADGFADLVVEHSMIAEAFASLPERWRAVLWEVDVQGRKAAEVGLELGLSPNAAAALTKRARQGLSRAWLQQLIEGGAADPDCEWVHQRASRYVRKALAATEAERVRDHLDECPQCSRAIGRLADLGRHLRVAALIAGGSAAGVFSVTRSSGTAVAAGLRPRTSAGRPRGHRSASHRAGRARRILAAAAGAAAVVTAVAWAQPLLGATSAAAPLAAQALAAGTPADRSEPGGSTVLPGVSTSVPGPAPIRLGSASTQEADRSRSSDPSGSAAASRSTPRPTTAGHTADAGPIPTTGPTTGPESLASPSATPTASTAGPIPTTGALPPPNPITTPTASSPQEPTAGPTASPAPEPTGVPTASPAPEPSGCHPESGRGQGPIWQWPADPPGCCPAWQWADDRPGCRGLLDRSPSGWGR